MTRGVGGNVFTQNAGQLHHVAQPVCQTFGDHRHSVPAAHHSTFQNRTLQNVHDVGDGGPSGELLRDERQGRTCRLADAQRQEPRVAPHGYHQIPATGRTRVLHQVGAQARPLVSRGGIAEGGHVTRQRKVVVDGLGHVNYTEPARRVLRYETGTRSRVVPADGQQMGDAHAQQIVDRRGQLLLIRSDQRRGVELCIV